MKLKCQIYAIFETLDLVSYARDCWLSWLALPTYQNTSEFLSGRNRSEGGELPMQTLYRQKLHHE